ncbi:hypothetical protein LIER_12971 [Lithospermum erythrorhizon]|uniref:Gag-pol polyprotein n=1 Tax=Lithospermum erythrorhizon TaxID=34254 RepID=A0AAV3PTY3_LITER
MELTKGIKMMNPSQNITEEILLQGKRSGDNSGIGFIGKGYQRNQKTPIRTRVVAGASPEKVKVDFVTVGGKKKIVGKGTLSVEGLHTLEDVLLVEGFTANLISVSQLCDNDLKVYEVIMGKSLRIPNFMFSVVRRASNMRSQPLSPHNRMRLLKEKKRTLQEIGRVMLHAKQIPVKFWAEVINTACHIHNRINFRPGTNTTSYEIWRGEKAKFVIFSYS